MRAPATWQVFDDAEEPVATVRRPDGAAIALRAPLCPPGEGGVNGRIVPGTEQLVSKETTEGACR